MEEDDAGIHQEIGLGEYAACSRCGRMAPVSTMAVVPADALEGTSEYEYLCAACQRALADGEIDLPLTTP